MKPADEPCLQLLHRSYCYLRLSGVTSNDACKALRTLISHLEQDATALNDDTQIQQLVWQQVRDYADSHTTIQPKPTPPLLRASMHYGKPGN